MTDKLAKIMAAMRKNLANIRFADLEFVCTEYFGTPRRPGGGSSHLIYKMPWPGDPRINIQDDNGKAKAYQVRQALIAIKKLEADSE